jgi:hypothetical protein
MGDVVWVERERFHRELQDADSHLALLMMEAAAAEQGELAGAIDRALQQLNEAFRILGRPQ